MAPIPLALLPLSALVAEILQRLIAFIAMRPFRCRSLGSEPPLRCLIGPMPRIPLSSSIHRSSTPRPFFPAITHVLCLRMEEWLAGGACDCSGCTAEAKSSAGRVGGAVQVVPELYPIFPRQGCLPVGALGGSRASQGLAFFFSFPTNTRLAWQAALSRAGLGPARLARLARQARQARLIPSSGTRAIPSSDGIGGTSCCLSCRAQG